MRQARRSLGYRLGLALVAVGMVVLPCLYVALTAAVVYGVCYFATHDFQAVWEWEIGHSKWAVFAKALCSVGPLFVGSTVALFLVKPLFARRAAAMQPLALNPLVEARVYALVQRVCAQVGSVAPHRIELDCALNASARLDGLWRGFFGNALILTLGLPLVAGLTERELAGVIAHEFGHFRQGAALRATYLIRAVQRWFARVVHERDGWDETLAAWSDREGAEALVVMLARAGVWLSRAVLRALMGVGQVLSFYLLRQMEFDADRAEVGVAGRAAFQSTTTKLAALGLVLDDIHREMRRIWTKQLQLPDNLPVLVDYRAKHLSAEDWARVEKQIATERGSWLSTHPSSAERVRRALLAAEAGEDYPDTPAKELFENFDMVSRLVTLAHYEDDLNVPTSPDFLIPLEKLIRAKEQPPVPPAPAPVPMMRYDPSAFRGKGS